MAMLRQQSHSSGLPTISHWGIFCVHRFQIGSRRCTSPFTDFAWFVQVIPFMRVAKPFRRIIQVMLFGEQRDRSFFGSLNAVFIPPPNSDNNLPVATAVYAEMMGSKEVI
jgi:hypothetical protein